MRLPYSRWIKMGQLSGMVVAFIFLMATATPLFLSVNPAHALSWALYYEVGRTFSLLDVYGADQSAVWPWFLLFLLSIATCFFDIRRQRFFASAFVLVLLLIVAMVVIYFDFFLEIQNSSRVALLSPWVKLAFLLMCSGFMYVALRHRYFQYRMATRNRAAAINQRSPID